jgi:hypothetical protein
MLGDAEPEPGTAVTAGRRAVGLRERIENVPLLVGRDAMPVSVTSKAMNAEAASVSNRLDAKAYLAFLGELDRIADQVGHDLAQPAHRRQRRRQARWIVQVSSRLLP